MNYNDIFKKSIKLVEIFQEPSMAYFNIHQVFQLGCLRLLSRL